MDKNNEIEYEPEYGGQLVLPLTTLDTLNPLISENISITILVNLYLKVYLSWIMI